MKKSRPKRKGQDKPPTAGSARAAGKREYRVMTVALIRDQEGLEAVEVAFSESARFYGLLRANPEFERLLQTLREAKGKGRPVRVQLNLPHGDVIEDAELGP